MKPYVPDRETIERECRAIRAERVHRRIIVGDKKPDDGPREYHLAVESSDFETWGEFDEFE